MSKFEHEIRRSLSKNLSFIGKDLNLVKEEYFLKNPYGAKGYIDILATDSRGNYVIIEIKRSNQAARQAIHELNKYPMLLRNKLGIKESQIRLILVSTVWHELLVPFSEYCRSCSYQLEGYKIKVSATGELLNKELISPIEAFLERKTSRRHLVFYYSNIERASLELDNICRVIEINGIDDYMVSLINKESENIIYPYFIYVCFQRYTTDIYIDILENLVEEYNDYETRLVLLDDMYDNKFQLNEEEFLDYLEDSIQYYVINQIDCDSVEISYPEKFALNFKKDDKVLHIKTGGKYKEDIRFSDENFYLKELMSFSDNNFNYYTAECTYKSKAQLKELKEKVKDFLDDNENWKNQILSAIKNFEDKKFNLSIKIFNPRNLFESFYSFYKYSDIKCLPHYLLFIENHDESKLYIFKGNLVWDGITNKDFNILNSIYYFNDFMQFYFNRYNEEIYTGMVNDLGCLFGTDVTILHKDKEENYAFIFEKFDFKYKKIANRKYIRDFFNENSCFLKELSNFFDKHIVEI